MGHNHIQVGALSLSARMATLPMPNTRPIATPHQFAMPLYRFPNTTLYTSMPGNHYPNYIMANHEGSVGTLRTSDASYLPTCQWKSYPLVALKYSTGHIDVSESLLRHEAMALQWHQQGGWWEFFAPLKFCCHSPELQNQATPRIVASNFHPPQQSAQTRPHVYKKP